MAFEDLSKSCIRLLHYRSCRNCCQYRNQTPKHDLPAARNFTLCICYAFVGCTALPYVELKKSKRLKFKKLLDIDTHYLSWCAILYFFHTLQKVFYSFPS